MKKCIPCIFIILIAVIGIVRGECQASGDGLEKALEYRRLSFAAQPAKPAANGCERGRLHFCFNVPFAGQPLQCGRTPPEVPYVSEYNTSSRRARENRE